MGIIFDTSIGFLAMKMLMRAKFSESAGLDNSIDIIEYIEGLIDDRYEKKSYKRAIEAVADEIDKNCEEIIQKSNITPERKDFLMEKLSEAMSVINSDFEFFTETKVELASMKNRILHIASIEKDDFDEQEYYYFTNAIYYIANQLREGFFKLKEFDVERSNYIISNLEDLKENVANVAEMLGRIDNKVLSLNDEYRNYESEYRKVVQSKYNYIELFGAEELNSRLKRYKLSTAYVELEVRAVDNNRIEVNDIFADSRKNIWLSGEAGSGKTTFLYWLVTNTASTEETVNGLTDEIPLLIKLRDIEDYSSISLPDCFNKVMKDSTFTIPKGWIEEKIKAGKILFLFDGFDEISTFDREYVFKWIDEVDKNDKCKKLFTSRPQITDRPEDITVKEVKMLPMTGEKVELFIHYWHNAVLNEKLGESNDAIRAYINNIVDLFKQNDSLSKLSTNPLLCAMLCALHYKNQMIIPSSKRDLYESCCKMLLEERDSVRKVKNTIVNLTYEEKKHYVSKIAYRMMDNNVAETSKEDTVTMLDKTLELCGKTEYSGNDVLSYLIERSGMLKEPEKGKISFVHKSFQEYLCAVYLASEGNWDCLIKHIGDPEWLETISIAIGYGSEKNANEILAKTLEKGKKAKDKEKYLFYALDYLNGAKEVDPQIRSRINNSLFSIFPPTFENYERVAKAGDVALSHLKDNKDFDVEQRHCSLLVLEHVGTKEALNVSKTYFKREISVIDIMILGKLYAKYKNEDILEYKIDDALYDYVKNIVKDCLCLSSNMFHYLRHISPAKQKRLCEKNINSIHLIDYNTFFDYKRMDLFPDFLIPNVRNITIEGAFYSLDILNEFVNLDRVKIIAKGRKFDLYELNKYETIYNVKEWEFVLKQTIYINLEKMDFLQNASKIKFVFLDDNIEIDCDGFKDDVELTIYTEQPDMLDLAQFRNIKSVELGVPDIYIENIRMDFEFENINGNVKEFMVDNYNPYSE